MSSWVLVFTLLNPFAVTDGKFSWKDVVGIVIVTMVITLVTVRRVHINRQSGKTLNRSIEKEENSQDRKRE